MRWSRSAPGGTLLGTRTETTVSRNNPLKVYRDGEG
jgi:hypothetical protein